MIENLPKIVYDARGNQYQVIDTQLFPIELDEAIENPIKFQQELYELLIKAARRCAYDLGHASQDINRDVTHWSGESGQQYWNDKHYSWLRIFSPDGMKLYRHELHYDIDRLATLVDNYREWFKDANIEDPIYDGIPF